MVGLRSRDFLREMVKSRHLEHNQWADLDDRLDTCIALIEVACDLLEQGTARPDNVTLLAPERDYTTWLLAKMLRAPSSRLVVL